MVTFFMNKSVVLFWCLFAGILVFAFGVQFAYSQSGGFATTQPSSGVSHIANEIVCDNCITSANVADGTITNAEISNNAGIFSRKIAGANGWHFNTGPMPTTNTWYPAIGTGSTFVGGGIGAIGMLQWANSYVEIICDDFSGSVTGVIPSNGGLSSTGLLRYNHNIIKINPQNSLYKIYSVTDNSQTPTSYQYLSMSEAPGGKLQFLRQYAPGTGWTGAGGKEPEITNFECVVKILSLCNGGSDGGATCGP